MEKALRLYIAGARARVAGQAYTVFHVPRNAQDTIPFVLLQPTASGEFGRGASA